MLRIAITSAAILIAAAASVPADEDDPKGIDFFEKNIRPVLVAHCYQCHSASSKELKGELRLDTKQGIRKGGESGAAVVVGKPDESLLIQALRHEDGLEMPKDKLPDGVIENFVKWVEMGAPDPRKPNASTVGGKINILEARKFWSFQPPKIVPPPSIKNTEWPKSEIDKYLLSGLEAKGLSPVADADRRTLIRRVYFDLIGLPPTPEEVDEILTSISPSPTPPLAPSTNDGGSGREGEWEKVYAALVDKLLAMPQFGERWGRHWLDVARYGESSSKERNIPYPYAWRYRDYVYDAVAADKPFDQFIREQVAGDLLPAKNDAERNEMLTATGFLTLGPKSLNTRNAEQFRMDTADEQLDVVTRGVMGLSVACARCHDHKFDPIPTADYYAMAGIFRSTEVLGGVKAGNNKSGYVGEFAYLKSEAAGPKPELSDADKERLAGLKADLADARQQLRRFRTELKEAGEDNADSGNKPRPKAKGKAGNQRKRLERKEAQALARVNKLDQQINELEASAGVHGDVVMGVRDAAQPGDCRINIRGEVADLGEEVPRGYVRVLTYPSSPDVNPEQSGRLQLAMWLTKKNNPLTARVMANRAWYHLFGRGIVATVDNFGALGEQPTNQPLLDYLAVRFMEEGWSTKKLIREIVLSRAYQLSSEHSDANYAADPDNTLVWRMNRRRLEAEAIRDAMLLVSGRLDLERPAGSLTQTITGGEIGRQAKTDALRQEVTYRSAYLPMVRGLVPDFLSLFDVADSELVVGQRDVTTVAPQALYMMNSPFVLEQARAAAERLLADSNLSDDAARLDYAFRLVLGHSPDRQQQTDVLAFLNNYAASLPGDMSPEQRRLEAWSSVCHTLLASAEFRYVY